jgi:hypothetical protein
MFNVQFPMFNARASGTRGRGQETEASATKARRTGVLWNRVTWGLEFVWNWVLGTCLEFGAWDLEFLAVAAGRERFWF